MEFEGLAFQILDKGIDDMEAGRELPLDEAFDLVVEGVKKNEREV